MKKIALFFVSLLVSFALISQLLPSVSLSSPNTYAYAAGVGKQASNTKPGIGQRIIDSAVSGATKSLTDNAIGLALKGLTPQQREHSYVVQVINGTDSPLHLVKKFKPGKYSWPLLKEVILPKDSDFGIIDGDNFQVAAAYQIKNNNNNPEFYIMGAYRADNKLLGKIGGRSTKKMLLEPINSKSEVDNYFSSLKSDPWINLRESPDSYKCKNNITLAGSRQKSKNYHVDDKGESINASAWQFALTPGNQCSLES